MEPTEEKQKKTKGEKKIPLRSILDGSLIVNEGLVSQLPFVFFLTLIAVLYIANRYHSEKILRELSKTQTEIRELRAESITTASKLMYVSKQSEVAKLVKENGLELEEATTPPVKLKVD